MQVLAHADRLDQGVDPITDHTENNWHTPGYQGFNDDVGRGPVAGDAGGIRLLLNGCRRPSSCRTDCQAGPATKPNPAALVNRKRSRLLC